MKTKLLILLTLLSTSARALDIKVTAKALEHTLRDQLFTAPEGRYYMRGTPKSPCFVYADNPRISFNADRIVVHVHTVAKLGTALRGACIGVSLNTETDVSLIPEAEGENIGFRDARIDKLSDNRELNFLLVPFLSRKLPNELKFNAAEILRPQLDKSSGSTGYGLTLDRLRIHSLTVQSSALIADVDAALTIN